MTESVLERYYSHNSASTTAPAIPTFFKPVGACACMHVLHAQLACSVYMTSCHGMQKPKPSTLAALIKKQAQLRREQVCER